MNVTAHTIDPSGGQPREWDGPFDRPANWTDRVNETRSGGSSAVDPRGGQPPDRDEVAMRPPDWTRHVGRSNTQPKARGYPTKAPADLLRDFEHDLAPKGEGGWWSGPDRYRPFISAASILAGGVAEIYRGNDFDFSAFCAKVASYGSSIKGHRAYRQLATRMIRDELQFLIRNHRPRSKAEVARYLAGLLLPVYVEAWKGPAAFRAGDVARTVDVLIVLASHLDRGLGTRMWKQKKAVLDTWSSRRFQAYYNYLQNRALPEIKALANARTPSAA